MFYVFDILNLDKYFGKRYKEILFKYPHLSSFNVIL